MALNNTEIIAKLKQIVKEQGAEVFDNASRASALLSDYLPGEDNAKTRKLLTTAINAKAFTRVRLAEASTYDDVCKALIRNLQDDFFMSEAYAVNLLGLVCGTFDKKAPTVSKPTPPPVPPKPASPKPASPKPTTPPKPVTPPAPPRTTTPPKPTTPPPRPTGATRPTSSTTKAPNNTNPYGINVNRYVKHKRKVPVKAIVWSVIALIVLVVALINIIPNMSEKDLYSPEIVHTYITENDSRTAILTILSCSDSGAIKATWETFYTDGHYYKVNMEGQISKKTKGGDVYVNWGAQTVEISTKKVDWSNEVTATIHDDGKSISTYANNAPTEFVSGNNDKYYIQSADDLRKLSGSGNVYILKNDIDLAGKSWTPIEGYTGTLLGGGHSIKNLSINASGSNVGFFSTLSGNVFDLTFENAEVKVTGKNENIGILAGQLTGMVDGISVSGTVSAPDCTYVGGVVGYATFKDIVLSDVSNAADVTGSDYVGGVFGYQYSGNITINNFRNSGTITAKNDYAGGIYGYAIAANYGYSDHAFQMNSSSNTGDVKGKMNVGGIAGRIRATSQNSSVNSLSNKSTIEADAYVGCLAGAFENIVVNDCTNTGSTLIAKKYAIDGSDKNAYVGGIAGFGFLFNNCTNDVEINYTAGGRYVGGIAGHASCGNNSMTGLTNNASVSGADYVGGIFGYQYSGNLEQTDLKNIATIKGSGDYIGGLIGYATAANYGYSDHSYALTDSSNTGDVSGKQYVGGLFGYVHATNANSSMTDLSNRSAVEGDAYVGCIAGSIVNIVVNSCSNTGSTLKANKYIISDAEKYAYVGGMAGYGYLFNNCTNEVEINYTAGGKYVGGIAGYISSGNNSMTELSNTASVSGADFVGGLFGYHYTGNMQATFFTNSGNITGTGGYVGGLAGYTTAANYGYSDHSYKMTDSSNTGDVSGKQYVGGLFGEIYSSSAASNLTGLHNSSHVSGEVYVGCIAGAINNLTINDCRNDGSSMTTPNGQYVGGIAGHIKLSNVSMSSLTNSVDISGAEYIGGIFGYQYSGNIQETSFRNSGNITASGNYAGGLIGFATAANFGYSNHTFNMTDSSNTGAVSGNQYVGGLLGHAHASSNNSTIMDSISTGAVTGISDTGEIAGLLENIEVK